MDIDATEEALLLDGDEPKVPNAQPPLEVVKIDGDESEVPNYKRLKSSQSAASKLIVPLD